VQHFLFSQWLEFHKNQNGLILNYFKVKIFKTIGIDVAAFVMHMLKSAKKAMLKNKLILVDSILFTLI
jgi:hypothetical protein